MAERRLFDDRASPARYDGAADFLTPDGDHYVVRCQAEWMRERWQGVVTLTDFARSLEQGDVCRLSAEPVGELRVIILGRVGNNRYEFIGLVRPDPFEAL